MSKPNTLQVDILRQCGPFAFYQGELCQWLTSMWQNFIADAGLNQHQELAAFMARVPSPALDLLLVDDAAIAALNNQTMACEGPTNILSFPAWPCAREGQESLGSLVLSVDTLRRECFFYSRTEQIHAQQLLAHGFAHVLGYDHGPDMDRLCQKICKNL